MKCPQCSCDKFEFVDSRLSAKVKNELIDVVIPCKTCTNCAAPLMDAKQMNLLRRAVSDSYRKSHKLLTSDEIIQYRENLCMSQSAFADYLKIGEASIKRWETHYIQETSHDDHIRVKCDKDYAESNYLYVLSKYDQASIFNGGKRFSLELFKGLASHMLKSLTGSEPYLGKIHFYTDFLHFKRYKIGITGNRYLPFKNGPSPYHFKIYSKTPNPSVSNSIFDAKERQTLDDIIGFYNQNGGSKIIDLSSKEKGYLETPDLNFISYKYSEHLLI